MFSNKPKPVLYLFALSWLAVLVACSNSPPESRGAEADPRAKLAARATERHAPANIKERKVPASPLSEQEMRMAKAAWKYFQNNTQPSGLVNAVDGFPSVTLWDIASYMGGLMTVYELGIIDRHEFETRTVKVLGAFNRMNFFRNELPNKVYHTVTEKKVNYSNQPGEVGFSPVDLGRLLIWLKIYKERYPQHATAIDKFVLRWDFTHMIDKWGTMFGAVKAPDGNGFIYVQEGRLGYEEYAAKGFGLWGFDTTRASKFEPYNLVPIYGIDIPYDSRDPRKYVSHSYVVTESYVMDRMELGWDQPWDRESGEEEYTDPKMVEFARRIFAVQAARYYQDGILTARTEHQLDQKPYFVYDTIYSDGFPWNTLTPAGDHAPDFAAVALKGALGIWAVWDMPYSDILFKATADMYDPEKGFYEGVYENGTGPIKNFTSNNNGIILECLLYKAQGKLLRFGPPRQTLWDKTMKECPPEARNRGQCMRG